MKFFYFLFRVEAFGDLSIDDFNKKFARYLGKNIPQKTLLIGTELINVSELTERKYIELIDEDYVEFTIMPKGFGSENNNALKMALPAEGIEGVKDFVVETALKAGGKPCPPIVVGVGIGGSSDMALKLGKKALLGKVGERNPDPTIAEMELECLERINKDGKGPMGLGGRTTALDVKILKMDTHTAGLPVGVVIQCWADRHATARLEDN